MMMRYWLICMFMLFLMLCTFAVIKGQHWRFTYEDWQYYIYWPAPWLLGYMAMQSWYQCFCWRRMIDGRHNLVRRVRGIEGPYSSMKPSRLLERLCVLLVFIGLWGILVQLRVENAGYWTLGLLVIWTVLKWLFSSRKSA